MRYVPMKVVNIAEILNEYICNFDNNPCYAMVIGANDGKLEDFLTSYFDRENLTAILVEPVADLHEALLKKFSLFKNLCFENVAIDKKNKTRAIYKLKHSDCLPDWTKGLASFSKKVITSHDDQIAGIKDLIIKQKVKCVTISSLLKKYRFPELNILQIDTEGYDFEIVKTIDFKLNRPEIIIFEHMHLTFYTYYAAINFLDEKNYFVARNDNSFDLIAVDRGYVPKEL